MSVERATLGFPERPVLCEVSLELRAGEVVAVIGRNGVGKTTLLRSLLGVLPPLGGTMRHLHASGAGRKAGLPVPGVAYLPQRAGSLLHAATVRAEIDLTVKHRAGARDPSWLVELLELAPLLERDPRELSVGERERVALAAVMAGEPRLLLLDEPTRGMDPERKTRLSDALRALAERGTCVVLATHDIDLVAELAHRVILLGDGAVLEDDTPRAVLGSSLTFTTAIATVFGGGYLTVADVLQGLAGSDPARARLAGEMMSEYAASRGEPR